MTVKSNYFNEPTLGQVMRRPKWLLALLLALAVAAGFAGLAQWQMGTAVKLEQAEIDSETVYPLSAITETGVAVTEEAGARLAEVSVRLVPGDSFAVDQRMNYGEKGAWVVSHAVQEVTGAHLAVALGWLPSYEEAKAFAAGVTQTDVIDVVGRYMPQESVQLPATGQSVDYLSTLSVGQIINMWAPYDGEVYAGYLVSVDEYPGLEKIYTEPPLPQETINWLNLFYAVEWVVFAGFAVFFWYRLARDAWEKEHELQALEKEAEVE